MPYFGLVYTKLSTGTVSMLGPYRPTLAQHRNVSCTYDMSCHCYPCVVLLKTRIVQILFPCTLPQTENCCPTTVYRNLQCTSLLIYVSGELRRHYTIESCVFFTVMLVIVFTVILMLFIVYFLSYTGV